MRQVNKWESFDGRLFNTEEECENHEQYLELVDEFEPIFGNVAGCVVEAEAFCEWAEEHIDWLKRFIDLRLI